MPRIIALVVGWSCPRTSWGPRTAPGHMSNVRTSRHFLLVRSWNNVFLQITESQNINIFSSNWLFFKKFSLFFLSCFWTGHLAGQLSHWFFLENSAAQQPEQQLACCLLVNSTTVCKNMNENSDSVPLWISTGDGGTIPRYWRQLREPPTPPQMATVGLGRPRRGQARAGISSMSEFRARFFAAGAGAAASTTTASTATDLAARGRAHALRGYKYEKRPDTRYGSS